MPTIEQFNLFITALSSHDWYYEMSDDHAVWQRGRDQARYLRTIAKIHPVFQAAYDTWARYLDKTPVILIEALRNQLAREINKDMEAAA